MTPRRPAPARPGVRRTSRPGPARGSRGTASGRSGRKSDSGADASRGAETDAARSDAGRATRVEEASGGADGLSLSMRLLILTGVVVLAFIVVFPSLRGYLLQRAQYDAVLEQIDEARATSSALEEELARWNDDEYVKAQARERLSYVMPGETTYVVVGADSVGADDKTGSSQTAGEQRPPWYQELRESARVAGQVEEDKPAEDPARRGWSTPTPRATATPEATAVPSDRAASTESGDQQ